MTMRNVDLMNEMTAREQVIRWAREQSNVITTSNPYGNCIIVFDWTTYTIRAKGSTWVKVGKTLGLS